MSHLISSRVRRAGAAVVVGVLATIGLGAGSAHAATGTTGYHTRSAATCKALTSPVQASQDQITVKAPTIYAANVSVAEDSQIVGFRQRLVKWNGSAWLNVTWSAVYSSPATDSKAAVNFSDSSGRTYTMPQFTFTAGPGYYAIVTDYYWYQSSMTSGGSDSLTAVHSSSNTTSYCTFSY